MDPDVHAIPYNVLASTTSPIKVHNRLDPKQLKPEHRLTAPEHNFGHKQAHRYKHPIVIKKFRRKRLDGHIESPNIIDA